MGENRIIDGAILLTMILLSSWTASQFGQLAGRTQEAFVASSYNTMAVVTLLIAIGAAMGFGFISFEGINKSAREMIPILIIGAVVGIVITSSGRLALSSLLTTPGAINPTLGFIFVKVLAVFTETYFFWGALFPSIRTFIGGRTHTIIAVVGAAVIVSFLFANWHIVATNGDQTRLMGEFYYSLFSIALLLVTGSIAAPLAAHFTRNLITG